MASGRLTIDLGAVAKNWTALDAMSTGETGAVVKADGYGLGIAQVCRHLAGAGVRTFFVAIAEEGVAVREALGPAPNIYVLGGHMAGDTEIIASAQLIPLLSSVDQLLRHFEALPGAPFGIQLDTGMNRLGLEPVEWDAVRAMVIAQNPALIMSHLACADDSDHPMNAQQLAAFEQMTAGLAVPRSLAATGGILLGRAFHFDITRPGVGLYGGMPYTDAYPTVSLDLPVIQVRDVAPGETVGYSNTWTAQRPSRIATVSGGYADGIIRAMGPNIRLFAGETAVPIAGRISMDSIGVDVTDAPEVPDYLELLGLHQSVDTLAAGAGTIGYEVLTSLDARLSRRYVS